MISEQKTNIKAKQASPEKTAGKKTIQTSKTSGVNGKLALILVRGLAGVKKDIKAALYSLRLRKRHACVVVEDTLSNRGATIKCKDYITYGEINDETLQQLLEKRGRKDPEKKGYLKKFFLLHPPRGGFERKGIKTPFKKGGALGYRGTKINDLIKKMI